MSDALTQDELTAKMNAPVAIGPRMFTLHEQGQIGMELRELRTHDVELAHVTRRMLQALDAYWEHCEGLSDAKSRTVRSMSEGEDWWNRYEKYRRQVEALLG